MSEKSLYNKQTHPHAGIVGYDQEARQDSLWNAESFKNTDKNNDNDLNPVNLTRRESKGDPKWETLILNAGTNNEIKMKGRYYTISDDRDRPLEIWSSPPETRDAAFLGAIKGFKVFVVKDSEKADDPVRKGWAEVVVLEITPKGEKPKVKKFSYLDRDFVLLRAKMSDIRRGR